MGKKIWLFSCMLVLVGGLATYTNCGKESSGSSGKKVTHQDETDDQNNPPITNSSIEDETSMVTVWQTTANNESITLPLREGFDYDFQVDWGDGSEIQTILLWNDANATHEYEQAGEYTVVMTGLAQAWYFNNDGESPYTIFEGGNKNKIVKVLNLGDMGWIDLYRAFHGCNNLTTFEGGVTDQVVNFSHMFALAPLVTPNTSNWNTQNVTSMSYMFYNAAPTSSANPDTSNWDTSNVENMYGMFRTATSANPDTSNWDTSNVVDMGIMFQGATTANPDTSNWNTSSVVNMNWMFINATSANPNMSQWNFQNVTNMQNMFTGATSFSTNRYTQMLIRIHETSNQSNVTLHAPSTKYYSTATPARNALISDGWDITDNGVINIAIGDPPDLGTGG